MDQVVHAKPHHGPLTTLVELAVQRRRDQWPDPTRGAGVGAGLGVGVDSASCAFSPNFLSQGVHDHSELAPGFVSSRDKRPFRGGFHLVVAISVSTAGSEARKNGVIRVVQSVGKRSRIRSQ